MERGEYYMMHYYYTRHPYLVRQLPFWPNGVIDLVVAFLFWLAIALITAGLIKAFAKHHQSDFEDSNPALNILRLRYAKGEISKKEFDEKKKDIS